MTAIALLLIGCGSNDHELASMVFEHRWHPEASSRRVEILLRWDATPEEARELQGRVKALGCVEDTEFRSGDEGLDLERVMGESPPIPPRRYTLEVLAKEEQAVAEIVAAVAGAGAIDTDARAGGVVYIP